MLGASPTGGGPSSPEKKGDSRLLGAQAGEGPGCCWARSLPYPSPCQGLSLKDLGHSPMFLGVIFRVQSEPLGVSGYFICFCFCFGTGERIQVHSYH